MNAILFVILLIAGSAAIFAGVGYYRGLFHLAPVPAKTKGHFILMLEKDERRENENKAIQASKQQNHRAENNVAPPSCKS